MKIRTAIGQDSHRFGPDSDTKPLILGGIRIEGCPGLEGNSDADVILHALTNGISGITGVNILGAVSDCMCMEQKIVDSSVYLKEAMKHLGMWRITHVSISLEGKRPQMAPHIENMRREIGELLGIDSLAVGITATSGEGLTSFGRGEGIQVFCIVNAAYGAE